MLKQFFAGLISLLAATITAFAGDRGSPKPLIWMMQDYQTMVNDAMTNSFFSQKYNTPVILTSAPLATNGAPSAWNACPLRIYTSYANLQTQIGNGTLAGIVSSAGLCAVGYDNESWVATPDNEKSSVAVVISTMQSFCSSLYSFNPSLKCVLTPALDLMTTLHGITGPGRYQQFLADGIITGGCNAPHVYMFDLQAQSLEGPALLSPIPPPSYIDFVARGVAQCRAANAGVKVIAGVTTNTSYAKNGFQIANAIRAVSWAVDGFWLNIIAADHPYNMRTAIKNIAPPYWLTSGSISGDLYIGQQLTYNPGKMSVTGGTLTQQWYRNGIAINGQNGLTYMATGDDLGTIIGVLGKYTSLTKVSSYSFVTIPSVITSGPAPPTVTSPAVITGGDQVGRFNLVQATFTGNPIVTCQWSVNAIAIVGATDCTHYFPTDADVGLNLSVVMTATNGVGSVTTSATGNKVRSYEGLTSPPASSIVLSGPTTYTQSANHVFRNGIDKTGSIPSVNYLLTWAGGSYVLDGSGGWWVYTGPNYVTTPSDPRVVTDIPANTDVPVIYGDYSAIGNTVQASYGRFDNLPTALADQWYRGGLPILGATNSAYTITTADAGYDLTVVGTGTNSFGSDIGTSLPITIPGVPAPPLMPYPRAVCPYQPVLPINDPATFDDGCGTAVAFNPTDPSAHPDYFATGTPGFQTPGYAFKTLVSNAGTDYYGPIRGSITGNVVANTSVLTVTAVLGTPVGMPASTSFLAAPHTINCVGCPAGWYIVSQISSIEAGGALGGRGDYQMSNTILLGISSQTMQEIIRPPWNVADVDYVVGAKSGPHLDPAGGTLTIGTNPCTWPTHGMIYCPTGTTHTGNAAVDAWGALNPAILTQIFRLTPSGPSDDIKLAGYDLSAGDASGGRWTHGCTGIWYEGGLGNTAPNTNVVGTFTMEDLVFTNSPQCRDNIPVTNGAAFSLITAWPHSNPMPLLELRFSSMDFKARPTDCCQIPGQGVSTNYAGANTPPYYNATFSAISFKCSQCDQKLDFNRIVYPSGKVWTNNPTSAGPGASGQIFNNYFEGCGVNMAMGHPECESVDGVLGYIQSFNTGFSPPTMVFMTAFFSILQSSADVGYINIHHETASVNSNGGYQPNYSETIKGDFDGTTGIFTLDQIVTAGGPGLWVNATLANGALSPTTNISGGQAVGSKWRISCGANNPGVWTSWCPFGTGTTKGGFYNSAFIANDPTNLGHDNGVIGRGDPGDPSGTPGAQATFTIITNSANDVYGAGHANFGLTTQSAWWPYSVPNASYFTHWSFARNYVAGAAVNNNVPGMAAPGGPSYICQGGSLIAATGDGLAGTNTITFTTIPSPDYRKDNMWVTDTTNPASIPSGTKIAAGGVAGIQITITNPITTNVAGDTIKIVEVPYNGTNVGDASYDMLTGASVTNWGRAPSALPAICP